MEEPQHPKTPTLPLAPVVINEPVENKEKILTPPKKVRTLPWIILGLIISLILAGIGALIWKWTQSAKQPDLIVNAPDTSNPSITPIPTPIGETTTFVTQDLLFEDKVYRNELARFEINVPLGWQIDDSGESGSILVIVDPKATIVSGNALLTFVNVSTGKASGETLESYVQSARDGLTKNFSQYVIKEDKDMTISGNTYHLIGGSYQVQGVTMKNRNLLLVFDNRGYAISATAPESVWPKKELLLNATIFSFKNF